MNRIKPNSEFFFRHSVGKTLKLRRKQLGLSLRDIAKSTRIRPDYLKAIEKNNFSDMPHDVHSLGFVRQYAKRLGLDSETAATKYLLERGPISSAAKSRLSFNKLKPKPAVVGSKLLTLGVISVILISVSAYLAAQFLVLVRSPRLEVTYPEQNQAIGSKEIAVIGSTTAGSSVEVNNTMAKVEEDGSFSAAIILETGLNSIKVTSQNRRGKITEQEITVLVE